MSYQTFVAAVMLVVNDFCPNIMQSGDEGRPTVPDGLNPNDDPARFPQCSPLFTTHE